MKKILTIAAACFCLLLAACGSKNVDPAVVAQKIERGETLTDADYKSMIDYCGDYAREAQKYYDIINAEANDSTAEAIKASDELAALYAKTPYLDTFRNAISKATEADMGKENALRAEKLSEFEAFPIDDVSDSALLNPDVVGDVVDMPATDSTGVIASGAGEAVK